AGQADVSAQRINQHADLRVDLVGQNSLQHKTEARPHLRRYDGEVTELLLGDAAETLDAIVTDVLRGAGAEQERGLSEPLHARTGAVRASRESAVKVLAEDRAVGAQQAQDQPLPFPDGPCRFVAELADTCPPGLGGIELLQNRFSFGPVPIALLD